MIEEITIILPEILLASLAFIMQILTIFNEKKSRFFLIVTILLGFLLIYKIMFIGNDFGIGFGESFEVAPAINFYKSVVLGFALFSIMMYMDWATITRVDHKMEFATLILLSTLGGFIAISSRDFVILFCGLELQALAGYALAAFNSKDSRSAEAGLKYFILGALMSALMLLGISFLYGFSGSINYKIISSSLQSGDNNLGIIIGISLVLSSIFFKLSAAPLHIWAPDVYEGAPVSVTNFFATAQKFSSLIVFLTLFRLVFSEYTPISRDLLKILAIFSLFIGAFGAIRQDSLKRLMAYSSVLNIGFVLIAVSIGTPLALHSALVYLLIYTVGTMGYFACLTALFGSKTDVATFDDLKGVSGKRKAISASIAIIMFSMIGLPPFAGFFGKYYVLSIAISEGEFFMAGTGILASVVAAFYYLKVVKFMYFNKQDDSFIVIPTHFGLMLTSIVSLGFTVLLSIFISSYLVI